MNWIKTTERLPGKQKKYPVMIECDGETQESYCTFHVKKQMFHFDMHHINWKVIAWFDLPEYEK